MTFLHGVASADPSTDAITIWTRVTTVDEATTVTWEVAEDEHLRDVVRTGTAVAHGDRDHTVHVRVDGLGPGRSLWYRFEAGGHVSPVGRASTLPASAERVRIGIVCCARYGSGWYHAYRMLADEDPDLVLHLGDYIYEDDHTCVDGRAHDPSGRAADLAGYRRRYAQQHSDVDVQRLHATCPWVVLWDDHEIAQNAWRRGAVGHDDGDDGAYERRRRAAVQAWSEWIPAAWHQTDGGPLDRHLRIGDLADVLVVDARNTGRSAPVDESGGPASDPDPDDRRTLLSERQRAWLHGSLATSDATWRLLANQVQLGPLVLGYLPHLRGRHVRPIVNPDQWDGYPADRDALFDVLGRNGVRDVVALSGDLHATFVRLVASGGVGGSRDATRVTLPEITTPSVTATSFAKAVRREALIPRPGLSAVLRTLNRDIEFMDLRHHGFTVLTIERDAVTVDVHLLDHVDRPATPRRTARRWRIERGDPVPHRVDDRRRNGAERRDDRRGTGAFGAVRRAILRR